MKKITIKSIYYNLTFILVVFDEMLYFILDSFFIPFEML